MAAPQGLMDIPMKLSPPEDEGTRLPPTTASPEPLVKGKEYDAPPSQLSGGTWERLSPGQFMYHPSEEDLALPDLPGHFAEIEVVGDLLLMPNGDLYEGGIEHDIDGDGVMDQAVHFGKNEGSAPAPSKPPMGEPDGDEGLKGDPLAKVGVPPGNSWENKPGPSTLPLKTKKNY